METRRAPAWDDAELICAEEGLVRTMGDRSLYERVLLLFVSGRDIERLREAAAAGDPKACHDLVHSLRGAAANLGLRPLAGLATDILTAYRDGGDPREELETFFALYDRTADAIHRFVRPQS